MPTLCLRDQRLASVHTNREAAKSDELCHLPKIVSTSAAEIEDELAGFKLEKGEGRLLHPVKTR